MPSQVHGTGSHARNKALRIPSVVGVLPPLAFICHCDQTIRPKAIRRSFQRGGMRSFWEETMEICHPAHTDPSAITLSQSVIGWLPQAIPSLCVYRAAIFLDGLNVIVSNLNLILVFYLHFPQTSPDSFTLHFGSQLGLQLLPI